MSIDSTDRQRSTTTASVPTEGADAAIFSQAVVLEQIAEGVIITDAAGRIVFVNPAAEALHGVKMLHVAPDAYSAVYHLLTEAGEPYPPDELPLARAVRRGETVLDARWRIRRPDGSVVRAIGSARPVLDGQGRQTGAVLTVHDDTARAEAEEAQRQSEERLSLAQAAARIGTYDYRLDTGLMLWSREMYAIYGLPPSDAPFALEAWRALVHPDDREKTRYAATFGAPAIGKSYVHEFRIVRPDGAVRCIESRADVHADASGRPARIVGVNLDITERQETEAALRASEALLRTVVEQMPVGVIIARVPDGEILIFNRASELMMGHPVLGATAAEYGSYGGVHADGRAYGAHDYPMARAVLHGETIENEELRYRRPDGRVAHLSVSAARIVRPDGTADLAVCTFTDISERKRHEEHQRLLIHELNHRTKNQLAIVQSLAQQTFKASVTMVAARQAFDGRLGALSAAHDLLTREKWEAAPITQVITGTLAAVCPDDHRVEIAGPDILLSPRTAVSLAMAVHELATNALKYGSLSVPGGVVSVRWAVEGERLRAVWIERGGPRVTAPARRGFGTRMVERALDAELAGAVSIDFQPDGVVCTIDAPVPQREA